MNQLRKSTLSNLRGKSTGEVNRAASQEDTVEESIAFDHDVSSNGPVVEEQKPEKPGDEAVVETV